MDEMLDEFAGGDVDMRMFYVTKKPPPRGIEKSHLVCE